MPVFELDNENISFPNPNLAEEDGLLAIGGDLSVDRLVFAYSNGTIYEFSRTGLLFIIGNMHSTESFS